MAKQIFLIFLASPFYYTILHSFIKSDKMRILKFAHFNERHFLVDAES